jgi:hypothetical protein
MENFILIVLAGLSAIINVIQYFQNRGLKNTIRTYQEKEQNLEKRRKELFFHAMTVNLNPDEYLDIHADHSPFFMHGGVTSDVDEAKLIRLFEENLYASKSEMHGRNSNFVHLINGNRKNYHSYWRVTAPTKFIFIFVKNTFTCDVKPLHEMPGYRAPAADKKPETD